MLGMASEPTRNNDDHAGEIAAGDADACDRRLGSAWRCGPSCVQRCDQAVERDHEQRVILEALDVTSAGDAQHRDHAAGISAAPSAKPARRVDGSCRVRLCVAGILVSITKPTPMGHEADGRGHRPCARRCRAGRSTRRARAAAARGGPRPPSLRRPGCGARPSDHATRRTRGRQRRTRARAPPSRGPQWRSTRPWPPRSQPRSLARQRRAGGGTAVDADG